MALQNYIKGVSFYDITEILRTFKYEYSIGYYSKTINIEHKSTYFNLSKEDFECLQKIYETEEQQPNKGQCKIEYKKHIFILTTRYLNYNNDYEEKTIYMDRYDVKELINYAKKYDYIIYKHEK
jgi:hypothetical protein